MFVHGKIEVKKDRTEPDIKKIEQAESNIVKENIEPDVEKMELADPFVEKELTEQKKELAEDVERSEDTRGHDLAK